MHATRENTERVVPVAVVLICGAPLQQLNAGTLLILGGMRRIVHSRKYLR